MPSSILFVDPSVTSASAIAVDGVGYYQVGATAAPPNTSSIDGECSDCEDCPPVPCSDPGDFCASYTVNFTFHNLGTPPDDGNYVGTITGSWYTWLGSASQIGGTTVLNIDLTVDFEVVDGVEACTWAMGMAGPGRGPAFDVLHQALNREVVGDRGAVVEPCLLRRPSRPTPRHEMFG